MTDAVWINPYDEMKAEAKRAAAKERKRRRDGARICKAKRQHDWHMWLANYKTCRRCGRYKEKTLREIQGVKRWVRS